MLLCRLLPAALVLATAIQAHFTFILPLPGEEAAEMILAETLSKEDTVNPSIAANARLRIRDAAGKWTDLKMAQDGHRFVMALPGSGDRVVLGTLNLGVAQRGKEAKPHLLLYYPKTMLGNPFSAGTTGGKEQVVEIVPLGSPGQVRLQLVARAAPVPGAEITVILPDGKQQKVTTDANGVTGPFTAHGRYGAWARHWEDTAGELDGKRYEQTRHYAMIVFDSLALPRTGQPLSEKTSSFGAVVNGAWLYVYGGHISSTHTYSTRSVSGRFTRRKLAGGDWEQLPGGTPLQGLNLAAYRDAICRVGGMQPRNAPGEKADNHSVAEVACYSGSRGAWEALPPLPVPRSSHDVAVVGSQLVVTGGWTMRGASRESIWAKTALLLDLANPSAGWREAPQPFERRALVTAVHRGRVYVIGGITPSGTVSTDVDVFDPATGTWTKGPALPGPDMNGFAPAACVWHDRLYASTGDGSLFELDSTGAAWRPAGRTTRRLAHRMAPGPDTLLIFGGAAKGSNLDLVEEVAVRSTETGPQTGSSRRE